MAKHAPAFLKIVEDAKTRIREITTEQTKEKMEAGTLPFLVDVREESEYIVARLPGATHLGKGIIERDIEAAIPDKQAQIILYCGGGYRSALAADNLQKMGYTNVLSMDGGFRDWKKSGYPISRNYKGGLFARLDFKSSD
jgi:rhodanese-related sulfurtransferase